MDTNVYETGSVEIWKQRHKISVDIRIFFAVYCVTAVSHCRISNDADPLEMRAPSDEC